MSEHMFGVTKYRLSSRACALRDRICREEGGHGYVQIYQPTREWLGWFTGPNRGEPFDRDLARRVLDRVTAAETEPGKVRRTA